MEPISTTVDVSALRGKSALITGGASGIGLATARAWAAAGAYITIADIQPLEVGQKLAAELQANYVWCDVTDWASQIAAFKSALAFSPTRTLDIVATFAGTAAMPGNQVDHVLAAGEPSLTLDPKQPNIRNIEVNLVGVYYSSWLALYYFRLPPLTTENGTTTKTTTSTSQKPDKSLILVASIGAYMDSPKASTYPASKFGVRGLFRSTRARSLADLGVRCNLLAPWFVDTPLVAPVKAAMASRGLDMGQVLAFARVEDCVAAATYCAVNAGVHGRAFAIQPEGTFDLKDDMEDGWGGDQLRPIMRRRREAGFDA
ncbi:hypothetical protein C8A03DRAFT_37318 [Achaetomium macrosporum]|uniref:Uncharacterized protein n=1 Tax=Achaetomium macrosporum TaxID=79813 RepID=A0AAN7C3S4_9PEZI|nr:hypothetical protein C8A03DRAFT_37318 [Achaetomium macrosporum]